MANNDFERQKLCYEQNCESARSVNKQMNQVPLLAMTLTGGLWFAAGLQISLDKEIRFGLLLFAGLCNLALVLAAIRIRDVFQSYIDRMEEFYPPAFPGGKPRKPRLPWLGNYSMISIYCVLIVVAGLMSFAGAFSFYWPFDFNRWCIALPMLLFLTVTTHPLLFLGRDLAFGLLPCVDQVDGVSGEGDLDGDERVVALGGGGLQVA